MKYPDLSSLSRTPHIVEGMIADVAYHEFDMLAGHQMRPNESYSRQFGELCMAINDGKPTTMHECALPIRPMVDQKALKHMTTLVLNRQNVDKQLELQRQLHKSTIAALDGALHGPTQEKRFSRIVELTCQALLTRYAHPNLLAYETPPHHEVTSDLPGHYDIGVVIKNPDETVASYFLQAKSFCLGRCNPANAPADIKKIRGKYRPIVQLVSGCCDLDTGSIDQPRSQHLTVPKLLLKEHANGANTREVKRLDVITDSLVFNMSSGLLLRGTNVGKNNVPVGHGLFAS